MQNKTKKKTSKTNYKTINTIARIRLIGINSIKIFAHRHLTAVRTHLYLFCFCYNCWKRENCHSKCFARTHTYTHTTNGHTWDSETDHTRHGSHCFYQRSIIKWISHLWKPQPHTWFHGGSNVTFAFAFLSFFFLFAKLNRYNSKYDLCDLTYVICFVRDIVYFVVIVSFAVGFRLFNQLVLWSANSIDR